MPSKIDFVRTNFARFPDINIYLCEFDNIYLIFCFAVSVFLWFRYWPCHAEIADLASILISSLGVTPKPRFHHLQKIETAVSSLLKHRNLDFVISKNGNRDFVISKTPKSRFRFMTASKPRFRHFQNIEIAVSSILMISGKHPIRKRKTPHTEAETAPNLK